MVPSQFYTRVLNSNNPEPSGLIVTYTLWLQLTQEVMPGKSKIHGVLWSYIAKCIVFTYLKKDTIRFHFIFLKLDMDYISEYNKHTLMPLAFC